jgi:uncharacterized Fe-S center protein
MEDHVIFNQHVFELPFIVQKVLLSGIFRSVTASIIMRFCYIKSIPADVVLFRNMITYEVKKSFKVDLLDAEGPDLELAIPNGKQIKKNYVGKNLENYNSMLVLSHFKGHPMGGYGGALKQLSIGVASSFGKAYIHGAGEPEKIWTADHDSFLESMADAAKSVVDYFNNEIVYINVMKNMSVDCDCCAVAEDPCIADIGMLASTDPVAIDMACLDLVYASEDEGKAHLIERIESRNGVLTVDAAAKLGIGSKEYELIEI